MTQVATYCWRITLFQKNDKNWIRETKGGRIYAWGPVSLLALIPIFKLGKIWGFLAWECAGYLNSILGRSGQTILAQVSQLACFSEGAFCLASEFVWVSMWVSGPYLDGHFTPRLLSFQPHHHHLKTKAKDLTWCNFSMFWMSSLAWALLTRRLGGFQMLLVIAIDHHAIAINLTHAPTNKDALITVSSKNWNLMTKKCDLLSKTWILARKQFLLSLMPLPCPAWF